MAQQMQEEVRSPGADDSRARTTRHWFMPAAAVIASVTVGLLGAARHGDPTATVAAPAVVTAAVSWRALRRR
jgi:hypothetical protein